MFFNHFFDHQIKCFNLSQSRAIRIISILIVSTIGISDSAVAGVLDKYCLSRVGQTEPIEESQRVIPRYPLPPFIGSVDNLPELYQKPCNAFSRFFDACTRKTFFHLQSNFRTSILPRLSSYNMGWGFCSFRNKRRGNKISTERTGEFWFCGRYSSFKWSLV